MRDNASVLTKCIAVSSRHLDKISHPLCFALTRPGDARARETGEIKRVLHEYLLDSWAFIGHSFRVFVKFTARG